MQQPRLKRWIIGSLILASAQMGCSVPNNPWKGSHARDCLDDARIICADEKIVVLKDKNGQQGTVGTDETTCGGRTRMEVGIATDFTYKVQFKLPDAKSRVTLSFENVPRCGPLSH